MKDSNARPVSVTVVVRSHDAERLDSLRRALFSIWSQDTQRSIELLLVTSGYRRELKAAECLAHIGATPYDYRSAGTRRFRHRLLQLQGDTRARLLNVGLREALGDYVMFLDDDDVLRQDALSRLLGKAESACADLVFGRVDIVFSSKQQAPEQYLIVPYSARPPRVLDLIRHNTAPLCSFLFRRPPPEALPVVDESLCSFEDYAMLLQLLQRARTDSVGFDRPVAEYWLDTTAGTQAAKYRETIAADIFLIEALRRRLVFSVSGAEILESPTEAHERDAFGSLLAEVKRAPDEAILIQIDQVIPTKLGVTYNGWAVDTQAKRAPLFIFALFADGGAALVGIRYARADVAARWRIVDPALGFSFHSPEPCTAFVALSGQGMQEIKSPQP